MELDEVRYVISNQVLSNPGQILISQTGLGSEFTKSNLRPYVTSLRWKREQVEDYEPGRPPQTSITFSRFPEIIHFKVRSTFIDPNNNQKFQKEGTGALIGKRYLLTSGHCLFSREVKKWASTVKVFHPIYNEIDCSSLLCVQGWTEELKEEYDFGLVILSRDIGESTGWMGIIAPNSREAMTNRKVLVSGFPAGRDSDLILYSDGKVKYFDQKIITHNSGTVSGFSGSGIRSKFDENTDGEKIFGIVTSGETIPSTPIVVNNYAATISQLKFNLIVDWMKRF